MKFVFFILLPGICVALASVPDVKSMYGWQLEMQFIRLGEGPVGKVIEVKCSPSRVKDPHDCMANGMFMTEEECLIASGDKGEIRKQIKLHIDQVYSKPPAGPNDWYASVLNCVHEVGPSWAS